jgi:adenine-specific DNA-methyltransferase
MLISEEGDSSRKSLGQYFTPGDVAAFMLSLSNADESSSVLEPSAGEGVFIDLLKKRKCARIDGYEIDPTLVAKNADCVKCESFVSADISTRYDLVIGNPPYIRWKNLEERFRRELSENALWNRYFNSLCDYSYIFMLKGVEVLKDGGELIFICPEYWMNTTNSQTLRDYFCEHGYFSDFYIFNESPIFKGATVSTIVFRFVKSKEQYKPSMRVAKFTQKAKLSCDILEKLRSRTPIPNVEYMELRQFRQGQRWVFAPQEEQDALARLMTACEVEEQENDLFPSRKMITLGDVCEIGNGMVSGLDRAFQIPDDMSLTDTEKEATILVYKAKNLAKYWAVHPTRYIYVPESIMDEHDFKRLYPHFHSLMQPNKTALLSRYSYGRELPYWQWCFKRSERLFKSNGKRIFIPCKERISAKSFVRFALADEGFFPTQDVTGIFKRQNIKESIEYILAYLNHPLIFDWIRYYGIVKGNIVEFSEKPLSSIPFRRIRWNDRHEVQLHDRITSLTTAMITRRNLKAADEINKLIGELIK